MNRLMLILQIFYDFFIDIYNKIPFGTALRRFILRIAQTRFDNINKLLNSLQNPQVYKYARYFHETHKG